MGCAIDLNNQLWYNKDMDTQNKKRLLVLVRKRLGKFDKNWDYFRNKLQNSLGQNSDIEVTMGDMSRLCFSLSGKDLKAYDFATGQSLDDFDLVVFRSVSGYLGVAGICALFLKRHSIPYLDESVKPLVLNKFAEQLAYQGGGLEPVPSFYAKSETLREVISTDKLPFSYPVIIKDNNGNKGKSNFLVHTAQEATAIIDDNQDVDFVVQQFIPNVGDYRVLALGGKPKMAILRQSNEGSHLNNTSRGASAELFPLEKFSPQVLADISRAAKLSEVQVAGVDLIFDKYTNKHYILEVNSSPQLATGALPEQKMALYAEYLKDYLRN